jgi:hypothetical protein
MDADILNLKNKDDYFEDIRAIGDQIHSLNIRVGERFCLELLNLCGLCSSLLIQSNTASQIRRGLLSGIQKPPLDAARARCTKVFDSLLS